MVNLSRECQAVPGKHGGRTRVPQPKVAVLMAVYRGDKPRFLEQAVRSMMRQTYSNLDVHIYKDGVLSNELLDVLDRFALQSPNVFLHEDSRNRGLAVCLNEMIFFLRGQYHYYARMDADDVSRPERIQRQVEFMESHPAIDVVGGSIVDIDDDGRELKRVDYPQTQAAMLKFFEKRNPIAHVTVMYRESFFEKAGLYPPVALEDGLYWMQGFRRGCQFHNLSDVLVAVRTTDDFLERRSGVRKVFEEFKIRLMINRQLRFGVVSYFYAVAMLCVQLMPTPIKKSLYGKLR